MANHPSALKRMRQSEKRRERNTARKSQVKTVIKRYLKAVENNEPEAPALLSQATSLLHKGVGAGVFHPNMASRTIARLSRRLPRS